jgi:formylglycine-generating enzyme required for sulfatase activity
MDEHGSGVGQSSVEHDRNVLARLFDTLPENVRSRYGYSAAPTYRQEVVGIRLARSVAKPVHRVFRGGAWIVEPWYVRSAKRNCDAPSVRDYILGFRLARTVGAGSATLGVVQ